MRVQPPLSHVSRIRGRIPGIRRVPVPTMCWLQTLLIGRQRYRAPFQPASTQLPQSAFRSRANIIKDNM
eukprot:6189094-Pleurochrysis_carterae.AAC.2